MRKPGRPSNAKTETVVVRHMDTGETIAWSDGQFASASSPLKAISRRLYADKVEVSLARRTYRVEHNAQGAALVMLAACGGRGRIISTKYGTLPSDTRVV